MNGRATTALLVVLGLALTASGFLDAAGRSFETAETTGARLAFAAVLGLGVGVARVAPGAALAAVWVSCLIQVGAGLDLSLIQVGVAVVAFHTSRHGSTTVVWVSGVSIPAAYLIGTSYVLSRGTELATELGISDLAARNAAPAVVLAAAGSLPLAVPWLLGLALRMRERAAENRLLQLRAESDAARATELAGVRAEQARLARDVHDVVGHSLAVILAQAESAEYLDEPDAAALQRVLATIASSARSSLTDVRQVLGEGSSATLPDDAFAGLLEPIAATGRLESEIVGVPRTLPPDQHTTAYRVLQEMLTNAVKHGATGGAIQVRQDWRDGLALEVSNTYTERRSGSGMGLPGMRRRLSGVGGRLQIDEGPDTFRVRAWMPTGLTRAEGAR